MIEIGQRVKNYKGEVGTVVGSKMDLVAEMRQYSGSLLSKKRTGRMGYAVFWDSYPGQGSYCAFHYESELELLNFDSDFAREFEELGKFEEFITFEKLWNDQDYYRLSFVANPRQEFWHDQFAYPIEFVKVPHDEFDKIRRFKYLKVRMYFVIDVFKISFQEGYDLIERFKISEEEEEYVIKRIEDEEEKIEL